MLMYVVGFQCYLIRSNLVLIVCFSCFELLVLTTFIVLSSSDPGYIDQNQDTLVGLLKQYECFEICPDCVAVKLQRSKHCDICQRCVKVYDHHCPWVNNCIGSHNHAVFYVFIVLMVLNISYCFVQIILLVIHIDRIKNQLTFNQWILEILLLAVAIVICGIFLIPVWLLFIVQSQNLLLNKTTYER